MSIENGDFTSRANHAYIRRVVEPASKELLGVEPRDDLLLDNLLFEDLIEKFNLTFE